MPECGVYFVGEVEDGGTLWQHYFTSFGGEGHDVIVVEGFDNAVDEGGAIL